MQPRVQALGIPTNINKAVTFTKIVTITDGITLTGSSGILSTSGASFSGLWTFVIDTTAGSGITWESGTGESYLSGSSLHVYSGASVSFGNTPSFSNGLTFGGTTLSSYSEGTWSPTFSGLTVVNGTGTATYAGRYTRIGNLVFFTVSIIVSGTCTVQATSGVTYINNLPFTESVTDGNLVVADSEANSYGTGVISSNSTNGFVPTWAAVNRSILISGIMNL